jgi:transcriptional regulator with XRE-family HTH domain
MTDLITIGRQIKARRVSKGWTQEDLARKARTSRARIEALENARAPDVGFKRLQRIMNALDLDLRPSDLNSGRPTLEQLSDEDKEETNAPRLGR